MLVDKPIDLLPGQLRCPRCFGKDVVPSEPRGLWDAIMRHMGRVPRDCRFCGKHFHIESSKKVERSCW